MKSESKIFTDIEILLHVPTSTYFYIIYYNTKLNYSFIVYMYLKFCILHFYLIEAKTLDLLSVFWKIARINCLTCGAVNSCANGPFPFPHLSSICFSDESSNLISSKNFVHLRTCCWICWSYKVKMLID